MGRSKKNSKVNGQDTQNVNNSRSEIDFSQMFEKFREHFDSESFQSGKNHSTKQNISDVDKHKDYEQQKDELMKKEAELKDKEIELLKRENELLRRIPTVTTNVNGSEANSSGSIFPFRDVEDSLNSFNGDDDYAIDKWIADVNEAAVGAGWNEAQKVVYAKKLLSGTAKQSLRTTKDVGTWEKLSQFLLKEFKKDTICSKVHMKMSKRKKLPNETFRSYLLTLQEIALVANIDDASIIDYCISGISDVMANKNILLGAKDIADFKSKLDLYAEMKDREHDMGTTKQKINFSNINSSERRTVAVKCFNCGGIGHRSKNCRNKSKGPKCYKCGDFGHISPNCTKVVEAEKKPNICAAINESQLTLVTHDLKEITIGNQKLYAMVDNGSDLNFMALKKYSSIGAPDFESLITTFRGAGSNNLKTLGRFFSDVVIDGDVYSTTFHIVGDDILPVDIILGKELISQTITILTPHNIVMKKFIPDNYAMTIERGDLSLNIGVHDGDNYKYVKAIKQMVANYNPRSIQPTDDMMMKIVLTDETPVAQRCRRLSPLELDIVNIQIDEWVREGIIRPSKSSFASPIVLSNKRDGTKRLCIDYRRLNKVVVKDRYPLPRIDDQIDQLQSAKYFTTLDLRNGFFHVPIAPESIKYTAFITPVGLFEFLRVPFGLCNSPAAFQRYINNVFAPLSAKKIVCIYMDDLVVHASSLNEAIERLAIVLKVGEDNGLQIKWSKCQFLCKIVEYLGFEVGNGSIKPSTRKKEAISKFPKPANVKNLQSFLGLTSYFRKFVEGYAIIAKPLTDMLRKGNNFVFRDKEEQAFAKLKEKLLEEPVLRIYAVSAETELHTDACKMGIGAILLQKSGEDNRFHPVFYYSKKTTKAEENYSSYELEVLAIITALKKFRVYLLGLHFTIATDCAAFKATMEKRELTSRIAGWALQLQEFSFKLEHRPGNRMRHVDALSRNPVVLTIQSNLITRIRAAQREDDALKPIFELLKSGEFDDYTINNGLLFKMVKGSLLLVVPRAMEREVISAYHKQGHFAVRKTTELIEREYFIPKLTSKVEKTIRNCVHCILSERKAGKKDGLLNPLPKGDTPLVNYHIDHLGSLTATRKSYKYILCVIDGFSKFVWLYPTKSLSTQETLQKLDIQKAVFGNPEHIITDRGTAFTSSEFEEYCKTENIRHSKITTGAPTGNGQVERINRLIIPVLTKLALNDEENWFKYVGKLQRYLNNSFQRSIAMSPFQLLTGVKMRCPENLQLSELIQQEEAIIYNEERQQLRDEAKQNILQIQNENRRDYNRRRKQAYLYKIGDIVAIKRTQFGGGSKIQTKYLGPYEIVQVKDKDRYDVQKIGQFEGPNKTSTAAEFLKLYYDGISDEDEQTENENSQSSEADESRRAVWDHPVNMLTECTYH